MQGLFNTQYMWSHVTGTGFCNNVIPQEIWWYRRNILKIFVNLQSSKAIQWAHYIRKLRNLIRYICTLPYNHRTHPIDNVILQVFRAYFPMEGSNAFDTKLTIFKLGSSKEDFNFLHDHLIYFIRGWTRFRI